MHERTRVPNLKLEAVYYAIWFRASDFYFSIWKKYGPAYADRFCKIRRDKIWFENPMAQVVRFWPKIRRLDLSDYQIEKWLLSLIKWKSSWAEPVQQQYEIHTKVRVRVRVAIDALDYEYNHDARTQSPRLIAARLQLAVGWRGLGPREQGEKRTQRASFVATYNARVHTE